MATNTLQNEAACEQHATSIYQRSSDVQVFARQIKAFARAADDALDYSEADEKKREAMERALLLIKAIEDTATTVADNSEKIEIAALALKRAA